jgi:hypothetical protein
LILCVAYLMSFHQPRKLFCCVLWVMIRTVCIKKQAWHSLGIISLLLGLKKTRKILYIISSI